MTRMVSMTWNENESESLTSLVVVGCWRNMIRTLVVHHVVYPHAMSRLENKHQVMWSSVSDAQRMAARGVESGPKVHHRPNKI